MRARIIAIITLAASVFALVVGTAVARSVATTKRATSITHRSAFLHGIVHAGTSDAVWLFEYGRTRALGTYSRPAALGSHITSVGLKLRHLRPGTRYYFRLVVTVGGYTSTAGFGKTLSFRTKR